jgi:FkbM family methyltransferase
VLAYLLRFGTVRIAKLLRSPGEGLCSRQMFGGTQLLDLDRSITQRLLYLDGERFVPERILLGELVRTGAHVVDVGANIGYYALLFRQLGGPDAHLTLIEPSEENLPELEATLAENALAEYTLHRCAVGRESGTVRIKRGINSGVTGADADGYDVPVRRLTDLCEGSVDLIKIDVEGFEP